MTASSPMIQPGITAEPHPMVTRLPMHTSAGQTACKHTTDTGFRMLSANVSACIMPSVPHIIGVKSMQQRWLGPHMPFQPCFPFGWHCILMGLAGASLNSTSMLIACKVGCISMGLCLEHSPRPHCSVLLTVELYASVLCGVCHHEGQVINHGAVTDG
jgi:hypothetical protein